MAKDELEVFKGVTLSLLHLPVSLREQLAKLSQSRGGLILGAAHEWPKTNLPGFYVDAFAYGYYFKRACEWDAGDTSDPYYEPMRTLYSWAGRKGIRLLLMDADGQVCSELPLYETP